MFELPLNFRTVGPWIQRRLTAAKLDTLVPAGLVKYALTYRTAVIRVWQCCVIALSVVLAFALRFDLSIPDKETHHLIQALAISLVTKTLVFHVFRVERGWWRYSGIVDLVKIFVASLAGSLLFAIANFIIVGSTFPRSVYVIDGLICFPILAGARFSKRLYHEIVSSKPASQGETTGILIYGAGAAGLNLVREIRSNPNLSYRIIGFLDDDSQKRNGSLLGIPVVGTGRDAARIVDHYRRKSPSVDQIVIAMPSASRRQLSEAFANCRVTGVPCKTIPSLGEMLTGRVRVSEIREVPVESLLGREPVQLEHNKILESITERSVMVTGAGGSIGSELCRQLIQFRPKQLVAFDQAESDLFRLEMELKESGFDSLFCPVIGDIRNYERIEEVLRRYKISSIYHAAAYKHVPMMENNLIEAAVNNVIGLDNVVQAASRNGASSFLMISSDKAVNPTNVMGLTKRVAELIVSSMPTSRHGCPTRFVSVRFGNVLGSSGSVVPIFRAQIAAGGPVTITHPEIRRYFMTIPEAVQLVLQASTMGKGSETFVLDMGEPVRILDLARTMIRLSGHEPDTEIPIRFVGLRAGEKLFEELSTASDLVRPTCHEKIMIFGGESLEPGFMQHWISQLRVLLSERDEDAILAHMRAIVPEYQPSGKWIQKTSVIAKAAAVGA
jgi:FlaA1/EpsC-like NDP-sugar epimerase